MPPSKPILKPTQLIVPTYTSRKPPPPFRSWLNNVSHLNVNTPTIITWPRIEKARRDTLVSLQLDSRLIEMESPDGKAAIARRLEGIEKRQQSYAVFINNKRFKTSERPDLTSSDVDIREYSIPSLGKQHVKGRHYDDFVAKVEDLNPNMPVDKEIVEACF